MNGDVTEWSGPYFITHPQRKLILKNCYDETLMDKVDLLCTVTDEELKQFIDIGVISWKPMFPYMRNADGGLLGFAPKYIVTCDG